MSNEKPTMTPERERTIRAVVKRGFFSEREGDPSPVYSCRDLLAALDSARAAERAAVERAKMAEERGDANEMLYLSAERECSVEKERADLAEQQLAALREAAEAYRVLERDCETRSLPTTQHNERCARIATAESALDDALSASPASLAGRARAAVLREAAKTWLRQHGVGLVPEWLVALAAEAERHP